MRSPLGKQGGFGGRQILQQRQNCRGGREHNFSASGKKCSGGVRRFFLPDHPRRGYHPQGTNHGFFDLPPRPCFPSPKGGLMVVPCNRPNSTRWGWAKRQLWLGLQYNMAWSSIIPTLSCNIVDDLNASKTNLGHQFDCLVFDSPILEIIYRVLDVRQDFWAGYFFGSSIFDSKYLIFLSRVQFPFLCIVEMHGCQFL